MNSTQKRWKTITSKKVYENRWITVNEDQVINPNGNPGIYGKVAFKNLAVGIIPLDQDNFTWIVGQHRYTLDEYCWEIPMGGVPFEEDLLEGAKRELLEETGIVANQWSSLLKIHTSNSVTDEVGYSFVAEDITIGIPQFDETENIQIRKLPFAEVINLVHRGEITDAISIASILKLARTKGL